jgi:hypothetical protein
MSASGVNRSACVVVRPPARRRVGRDQGRLERLELAVGPVAIPVPGPLRAPIRDGRSTGPRPRGDERAGRSPIDRAACRAAVAARFTVDRMADRYLALCRTLVG